MNADGIQIPRSKLPGPASAPARLGASWKYDRGRSCAGNVGQASRLPCRAVRRGFRTTKASLRSAGQARRLPYVGGTDKMRPQLPLFAPSLRRGHFVAQTQVFPHGADLFLRVAFEDFGKLAFALLEVGRHLGLRVNAGRGAQPAKVEAGQQAVRRVGQVNSFALEDIHREPRPDPVTRNAGEAAVLADKFASDLGELCV